MKKRVKYPVEIKWKAVKMEENGYTNREIMRELGIKNKSQIKTWMKWYQKVKLIVLNSLLESNMLMGKGKNLCQKYNGKMHKSGNWRRK
jgi:hypothetical protein